MDFVGFPRLCNSGAPEMLFGLAGLSDTSLHPGANVTAVRCCLPLLVFAHREKEFSRLTRLCGADDAPQLRMDPGSSANFQPWI